jgi:hypothetical protein
LKNAGEKKDGWFGGYFRISVVKLLKNGLEKAWLDLKLSGQGIVLMDHAQI